jgi:hypothetical protein
MYLHTKNTFFNFVRLGILVYIFHGHSIYFVVIWYMFWPFSRELVVIWCILPVWVNYTKENLEPWFFVKIVIACENIQKTIFKIHPGLKWHQFDWKSYIAKDVRPTDLQDPVTRCHLNPFMATWCLKVYLHEQWFLCCPWSLNAAQQDLKWS